MRSAKRTDGNHTAIREALRAAGCTVADTSGAGDGFPDLVAGLRGTNWLIEVKNGTRPPSARKLTAAQIAFHAEWRGQISVVKNVEEAIALVNGKRTVEWMP